MWALIGVYTSSKPTGSPPQPMFSTPGSSIARFSSLSRSQMCTCTREPQHEWSSTLKEMTDIWLVYIVYLKCWVTYFTSSDSSPNASVVSRVMRVDEDGGSLSTKGLLRHHERSSSPLKLPGPNMQQLSTPSLSTWLLWRWPLTINSILWTGSPSLVIYIAIWLWTEECACACMRGGGIFVQIYRHCN